MSDGDIIDDVIRGRPRLWCVELMKARDMQILMACEVREIGFEAHIGGCRGDNT